MPSSTLQQLRKAHYDEEMAIGYRTWCQSGHKNIMRTIYKSIDESKATKVELRLAKLCNTI